MATRIRLQRHGKKGKPFYYIVAADQRSKRDGKFIERFGSYNPTTNPATIEMDFDRALHWVKVGADPSDTARAILSYRGVLHKAHLDKGVLKGAMTQEQADAKFAKWLEEKDGKNEGKKERLSKAADSDRKKRLAAEAEVSAKRAAELAAKANPPAAEESTSEESTEENSAE
jgi:small subunit ribosomal protein S16